MGATTDLKLWTGLAIGPVAWAVQLFASYPVAQLACRAGFATQHPTALHTISTTALVAIAAGAALSWTAWKQAADERRRFMALLGLLTCATFALVVLATWVPPFIMHNCEA